MAETDAEAKYKQDFMGRVAEARIARGWKQWQAAEALDMAQDKYKQYETRSLMPHHIIGRFCLVARVDMAWLLTGRGRRPIKQFELIETPAEPQAKRKSPAQRKIS